MPPGHSLTGGRASTAAKIDASVGRAVCSDAGAGFAGLGRLTRNNKDTPMTINRRSSVVFSILLASAVLGAQAPANFSGKWAFDKNTSNLGGSEYFVGILKITQTATTLTIDSTVKRQGGADVMTTDKFNLDGKEALVQNNDMTTKITAKWSEDKKSLTITTIVTLTKTSEEYRTDDTYHVAEDGTTLTMTNVYKNPTAKGVAVVVFNRSA
jgi:hypothetical protein